MGRLPLPVALLLGVLWAGDLRGGQWDYSRTPILFVHGYFVIDQAGSATWANFSRRASEDGWPEEYLRMPSFREVRGCNDEHVQEIAGWVDELRSATGFDQVDIVCHSMGCMNVLSYLKSDLCGVRKVRRFVGLAAAVHGTTVACLDPFSCGARTMCIGSRPEAWRQNEFLAGLNACDETPGDIEYTSLWSEYDEIIVPPAGSQMAGARNIELDTPFVEHGGIFLCDECWERTRSALLEGGANEDGPGWGCVPEHCRPEDGGDRSPETADDPGEPPDVIREEAADSRPVESTAAPEESVAPDGSGRDVHETNSSETAQETGSLGDRDQGALPEEVGDGETGPLTARRSSGCMANPGAGSPLAWLPALVLLGPGRGQRRGIWRMVRAWSGEARGRPASRAIPTTSRTSSQDP